MDVHVDTNIGKHLSSLGHTLTTLTGEYEEEGTTTADDGSSASDDFDDLDLSSSGTQFNRKFLALVSA